MEKENKKGVNPFHSFSGDVDGGFKRLKKKNSARHVKQRVYYFLLLSALSLIFIIGIVAVFFRVTDINIKGSTVYTDREIIASSGIKKGENIYSVKEEDVQKAILLKNPYVRSVKVKRSIPNKINIDLKCDSPDFYVDICGEYFVISPQLRVLERFFEKEELLNKYPDIILFKAGNIRSAIVGSDVSFVNESYEDAAKDLLSVLCKTEVFEGVSSVDFSDRFNVKIVYDSRLEANIGNGDDVELKLRFMNEIVKDLGNGRGSIDIKDVETAYVLLDGNAIYD